MEHPEEAWIFNGKGEVPATARRVKIAENITRIPDKAFQDHQELEEVVLSSSVQVIGRWAFRGCKKLKSILYQGIEKEEVGIPSNVNVIEIGAFGGCTSLATLVLNEGLEGVGEYAFSQCKSITEVSIPSTVKVIDNSVFWGCEHLARLGLKEGLERIGKGAFMECFSLSHVRIPQSVNSIADIAFVCCSRLISIELPEDCSFKIDLSGCQSLVSLAGRSSIFCVVGRISMFYSWEVDRRQVFQKTKLGSLVDNEADLIRRLNHRFDNSPLNQLCYYQSYHSYEDEMAQLHRLMEDDPLAATTQVDEFGMTPLHILSLSQTLNMDMLLAVMHAGRLDHIIFCKDSFGSTAMDYLCFNRMPTSTEVIRRVLEARFAQLLGLDRSLKSKMLQATNKALKVDWPSRRREVVAIYLKLAKYERKEIFSLVELRLWKTKIDNVTTQEETVDREFFRVNSGASIVLPHVQPFLDELDVEAYFASYPDQFEFLLD
eukprot:scaffold2818_cov59-Cylindrotheca_fusiformis.AAC.5